MTEGVPGSPEEIARNVQTFRDFFAQFNRVAEACFTDCVRDFTTRDVSAKEQGCTEKCMDKYLKMTQRLSLRFQEHQLMNQEVSGAIPK